MYQPCKNNKYGTNIFGFHTEIYNISVIQHRDFNSYKYQLPGMSFYHLVELMISWSFSAMKSMKMSAQQNR